MLFKVIKYSIVFVVIFINAITAQNKSVRFNHIDIDQGLSQNMIRDVIQDSRGFMWIATWDGLNRFDGYNFKVYKNIDGDSTSLRINKIIRVLEDHNGVIWVGTFGGGLAKFNRKSESFKNYLYNSKDPNSLGDNQVLEIYEDSKNRMWIGTRNGGVFMFQNKDNQHYQEEQIKFVNYRNIPNDSTTLSDNGVISVFEDSFGSLWFGTLDGLLNKLVMVNQKDNAFKFLHYDSKSLQVVDKSNYSYENIIEDKNYPGLLWLVDYYTGITWFDVKKEKFIDSYPFYNFSKKFPKENVESVLQDSDGIIWIGTYGNGIYTLNLNDKEKQFDHFRFTTADPTGIDAPNITGFYEDKSGMIWIGTNTNGLYTYYKGAKSFKSYYHISTDNNSLISNNVLGILETNDGFLWIATELGLDKYNPVTDKYIHYKNDPQNSATISSNVVYSLLQDSEGTLWVGTADGLDKYNKISDSFSHYLHNPDDPNSISKGEIIKLFEDSKGTLWIGSWNGGLNKFVPGKENKSGKFMHYKYDKNDHFSLSDNRIMSMAEDKNGKFLIGTSDGGLNIMISDYKVNDDGTSALPKFKRYQHQAKKANSLSNNDVRSILIDKRGTYWLGTMGGGLNKFVPGKNGNDKFIHFRQADGLVNDVVRGLLEDDKGNIWIGTGHGLSKFDPITNTFWNLDKSDGLQTSKFEDASFKSKRDGTMYFGGVGGVVAFHPGKIQNNKYVPPVVITSLKRYNITNTVNSIIEEKGISEKNEIVLSYKDNIITFELAALNFYNSYKNEYSYKLEGYNDNWINIGRKRDITFTNLDHGSYTLFVRGSNNDGVWNLKGKSIRIIVIPPWYMTGWAYLGYGIILIFGLFLIDKIQKKKLITKERNKSQLREAKLIKKQAGELETVDILVKIINRAKDLESLFNSLLEQTIKYIPQAEKAAVFLLNKKESLFRVAYTSGYQVHDLESISFSAEELKKRYIQNSEEVERGILIIKDTENLPGDKKMLGFTKPLSMMVMAVERDNIYEAFVVYDNFKDKNAFDLSAAGILNRFREHAVSAILKAQSLKALQEKNEEIIKTQEQLITQQKLASLGALTAGIAHEIKNPLNFVNNFAELSKDMLVELEEEIESEKDNIASDKYELIKELIDDLKLNFEKINSHGNRADSIIKGMLLHSRGKSGERAMTDLNYLLDQYLMLAYHGLRAQDKEFNISIEKEYDESIGKINIIPQDISRVFLNLINNACYAANKKYKSNRRDFSPMLKVKTKNLKNKIKIYIRDNGTGIPMEIREKLFNPFFTTKPTGEGTGLGLSISYDIIVKGHNGEINYDSKEGEYTEFIISLPKN